MDTSSYLELCVIIIIVIVTTTPQRLYNTIAVSMLAKQPCCIPRKVYRFILLALVLLNPDIP